MDADDWLTRQFEQHRPRLQRLCYRMLGSRAEADDALQDAWVRLSGAGPDDVANPGGWLTTAVARVCLNRLRSRAARPEVPVGTYLPDPVVSSDAPGPADEAVLADSVSLALLVVLDTLTPAERVAFVMHDMFDLPFEQIAALVDRSPAAARQLASRARRRIRGAAAEAHADPADPADPAGQRRVVQAFFAAARGGDLGALIAVLDPDVVLRADGGASRREVSAVLRGSADVARRAAMFNQPAAAIHPVLVNGTAGAVVTGDDGRPISVMGFTVTGGRITEIDILLDPVRLDGLDLARALLSGLFGRVNSSSAGRMGRVVRYRVLVSGVVQGVSFRAACRQAAERQGVSGWVRNLPDGSVEAVFEGPAAAVDALVEWSRHGPRFAAVTDVRVQAEPPEGLSGFQIRERFQLLPSMCSA